MVSWARIKNRPGSPYAGPHRHGHWQCMEAFNNLIACGQEARDCRSPLCCFSARYDHEAACAAYEAYVSRAEANKNKWVALSWEADWHPAVPEGMVGIVATLGRDRSATAPRAWYLVARARFDARDVAYGYVVCDDDQPWPEGPEALAER